MKNSFCANLDNQLLIKPPRAKTPIPASGRFSIKDNQLVYYINEPASWRRKYALPKKITFTRKFLKNHDAQAFIRLEKLLGKEDRAEVGVCVPF